MLPLGYDTSDLTNQAQILAAHYGFSIQQQALPRLQLTSQGLVLLIQGFSPLSVDFNIFLSGRRLDKHHGLIKACKPTPEVTILDVTAGWGRDAGLLAQHGAHVVMIERQPIMAALLADGLDRMIRGTLDLTLIHQDALTYLTQLKSEAYPDVIYIDPMHPERQKAALVKKEMQALQQLFGPDHDAVEVLDCALKRAKKRVVVKWPQKRPPLSQPHASINGKTIRYDVYTQRQ